MRRIQEKQGLAAVHYILLVLIVLILFMFVVEGYLRHHGLGRQLYARLEALLRAMRIVNVNACIAYPATAEDPYLDTNSPDFHAHLGYQMVGRFHRCAYKFDRWYDMIWMEKRITALPEKPLPMIPFPALAKEVTTGALD